MFHTLFYDPIYNLLVLVLTYVPLHDIGAAILIVTLIVKLILLPLNLSALRSQYIMKKIEGEMNALKEEQKTSPQEASRKMMELYKREKVNPFASLLVMVIQIPIIYALYRVFSKGLYSDAASLYSFIHFPANLHTLAFGLFDVTHKNIYIAVLAGLSSYMLARRQTQAMVVKKKEGEDESFQDQFMKSMKLQLLYVLPVIITFSAAVLPSALGYYWFINSTITYLQDIYMKKKLQHLHTI
jgi:YidC/Oxa1 family membrane protein insertase